MDKKSVKFGTLAAFIEKRQGVCAQIWGTIRSTPDKELSEFGIK